MLENVQKIYQALEDDISRKIFMAQLSFSVTGDVSFIRELPMNYRNLSADIVLFNKKINEHGNARLVIFGAGANGVDLVKGYKNLDFFCFVDNYKQEKEEFVTGLPIYSFFEYKEKFGVKNTIFIVSVYRKDFVMEIFSQLTKNGVSRENILYIADWRNNASQYFDVFVPHEHETFVDCGCYDGSTAFRFAGWCAEREGTYDKIWCFEPDEKSYERCNRILRSLDKCFLYPYGVADKNKEVLFMANGRENARILETDKVVSSMRKIKVKCLDEFLANERVTFIKMDVEGGEYKALEGAKALIKEQKPRLAISVYHRWDDIIRIPELILSLESDYRFYIRHYSLLPNEIVLYAECR